MVLKNINPSLQDLFIYKVQRLSLQEPGRNNDSMMERLCLGEHQIRIQEKWVSIWKQNENLTLVTFMAAPSGKFLWIYSRNVSAVEPVSLGICDGKKTT